MDLIIVADRGAVKAFSITQGEKTKAAHLVETYLIDDDRGPYRDKVTDQASSFRSWGATAEKTGIELENEQRALRHIVQQIELLLKKYAPSAWSFAAPAHINGTILEELGRSLKIKPKHNLKKDLINIPTPNLLSYFEIH